MPASDEWVRVTQAETGHHITVAAALAEDPQFKVHDKQDDATTADGRPRLPKYHVDKGSASNKASATKKES